MKTGDILLIVLDCFNVFVAWLCMLLGKCGRGELCDDVINRRVVSLCVCYLLYVYIFFDNGCWWLVWRGFRGIFVNIGEVEPSVKVKTSQRSIWWKGVNGFIDLLNERMYFKW